MYKKVLTTNLNSIYDRCTQYSHMLASLELDKKKLKAASFFAFVLASGRKLNACLETQ